MERKSSLESRNKQSQQIDEERNHQRHHMGSAGGQACSDEDFQLETVIYKLDSRNKIVLPPIEDENTDYEFLNYIKNRAGKDDDFKETFAENQNILNQRRRNKHTSKRHRRRSRESEASFEEPITSQIQTRMSCQCQKNKLEQQQQQQHGNFIQKRRLESDEDYENVAKTHKHNKHICSCKRSSMHNEAAAAEATKASSSTRYTSQMMVDAEREANVCEKEMIKFLQTILNKLSNSHNASGANVEISVEPPIENDEYQQQKQQGQAGSIMHNDNDASYQHPEFFTYPTTLNLDENSKNSNYSQAVETKVLGKQFELRNEEISNEMVQGPQMNQQRYSVTLKKNYPTEFHVQHPQTIPSPQATRYQSQTSRYSTQASTPLASQEYNPQGTPQTFSPPRVSEEVRGSMQPYDAQNLPQPSATLGESQEVNTLMEQTEQQATSSNRTSNVSSMPQESPGVENSVANTSYQSTYIIPAISGQTPTIMIPPPLNANRNYTQFLRVPNTMPLQQPISYPVYPFAPKNGLQNISADNCRVIPSVRVVDFGNNNQGSCGCGCAQTPPPNIPNPNESYEYVLMRVKKNKP